MPPPSIPEDVGLICTIKTALHCRIPEDGSRIHFCLLTKSLTPLSVPHLTKSFQIPQLHLIIIIIIIVVIIIDYDHDHLFLMSVFLNLQLWGPNRHFKRVTFISLDKFSQ